MNKINKQFRRRRPSKKVKNSAYGGQVPILPSVEHGCTGSLHPLPSEIRYSLILSERPCKTVHVYTKCDIVFVWIFGRRVSAGQFSDTRTYFHLIAEQNNQNGHQ